MTHKKELPRFLTVEEVADALGISRSTIYRIINMDAIPHVKIGSSVRIPASWFDGLEEAAKGNVYEPHARKLNLVIEQDKVDLDAIRVRKRKKA